MPEVLACSFCGKTQREVKKLVAGPRVWICEECIVVCVEMLADSNNENRFDDLRAVVSAILRGLSLKQPEVVEAISATTGALQDSVAAAQDAIAKVKVAIADAEKVFGTFASLQKILAQLNSPPE